MCGCKESIQVVAPAFVRTAPASSTIGGFPVEDFLGPPVVCTPCHVTCKLELQMVLLFNPVCDAVAFAILFGNVCGSLHVFNPVLECLLFCGRALGAFRAEFTTYKSPGSNYYSQHPSLGRLQLFAPLFSQSPRASSVQQAGCDTTFEQTQSTFQRESTACQLFA